MFKLGVYRLEQYQDGAPATFAAAVRDRLSRNRISLQLFRADVPAPARQVSLFEHALPLLRLSSGVYRTTFRGRFRDLDVFINDLLERHFGRTAALCLEDWAASDCLTSTEWAASLADRFPNARLTASDLTLFLIEASLPGGEAFILEASGAPLQYIRPPFVIRMNPPEPKLLAVNWLMGRRALGRLERLRRGWKLPEEWLAEEGGGDLAQPPFMFRKIPLIHPEAQALRRESDRFAIRKQSVFEPAQEPCHAIRSMNIFNLAYFSAAQLAGGATAVWRSLAPGGIWIVGRTFQENPPAHNASAFVKQERGFRLLERYGKGSEIDEIVLGLAELC